MKEKLSFGFVIAIAIGLIGMIVYSTTKSGFGIGHKTFYDWMSLLIVPLALAIGAFFLNKSENDRERKSSIERNQEATLQYYFEKVTDIFREVSLQNLDKEDINTIRILTFTSLKRVDGERKRLIIQFLYENELISHLEADMNALNPGKTKDRVIDLKGADLSYINLSGLELRLHSHYEDKIGYISKLDLSNTDMRYANLTNGIFEYAFFKFANLSNANLAQSDFTDTDFSGAKLVNANLKDTNLMYANFLSSDLSNANFSKSKLFRAKFFMWDPHYADFKEANLTNANLRRAIIAQAAILPKQLNAAKSFYGVRISHNVNLYGRHKLFKLDVEFNRIPHDSIIFHGAVCPCGKKLDLPSDEQLPTDSLYYVYYENSNERIVRRLWDTYYVHQIQEINKNIFQRYSYKLLMGPYARLGKPGL